MIHVEPDAQLLNFLLSRWGQLNTDGAGVYECRWEIRSDGTFVFHILDPVIVEESFDGLDKLIDSLINKAMDYPNRIRGRHGLIIDIKKARFPRAISF